MEPGRYPVAGARSWRPRELPTIGPAPRIPPLLWVIFGATLFANVGGEGAFGYKASGLAWVVPLGVAVLVVARNPGRVTFPLWVWAPWAAIVAWQWLQSPYPGLQRSVQLLCPLAIGAAVSTFRYSGKDLARVIRLVRWVGVALVAIVGVKTGVLLTGVLPIATGLSAEVMTAVILAVFFAAWFSDGHKAALRWWLLMALVPVVALTRTALVAAGLTLPLTLAPLGFARRALLLVLVAAAGWGLFFTPRLQGKMFKSGAGEMTDVLDKNFADSGRFSMWERMREQVRLRPWFGHGTGAGELFVRAITQGQSGYPHNDWLLTAFDYGLVGAGVFAASLLAAGAHALLRAGDVGEAGEARVLLLAGASAFIPFALIMYTDNVMVYVSFFGNLQFTMLGLGYAATSGGAKPGGARPGGHAA